MLSGRLGKKCVIIYPYKPISELHMQYTLITSTGKIKMFFVKQVAELYQTIEGGVIMTSEILTTSNQNETQDAS